MPEPVLSLELSVVNLPEMLDVRRKAREDAEWYSTLNPVATTTIEPTEAGMAKTAEALASTQRAAKPRPGQEAQATPLGEPLVRRGVSESLRVLFGFGLDDLQRAIDTDTLPELIGRPARQGAEAMGTLGAEIGEKALGTPGRVVGGVAGSALGFVGAVLDQGGRLMEPLARDAAARAGTPPELIEQVVGNTVMLAGILFPPGAGAGKAGKAGKAAKGAEDAAAAAKAAEKTAAEAESRLAKLREILASEGAPTPAGGGKAKPPEGGLRLNLDRINAEDSVKSIMAQVNREAETRLAAHRRVQTNLETIDQAKRVFPRFEDAYAASLEELILDKAKEQRHRDYYVALGKVVEDLAKRAVAGDADAQAKLPDVWIIFGQVADKDEMVAAHHARSMQARQILSDPSRVPSPNVAARDTQRVADTIKAEERAVEDLTKELAEAKQAEGVTPRESQLEKGQARVQKLEQQIADAKEQGKAAESARRELSDSKKEAERLADALREARANPRKRLVELEKRREGVLARLRAEQEAVTISRGEAVLQDAPELEGQIPLTDKLRGLQDQVTNLNTKIARTKEIIEASPGGLVGLELKLERATAKVDELTQQIADAEEAAAAAKRAEIDLKAEQEMAAALKDELKQIRERSPNLARLEAAVQHTQDKIDELRLALEDARLAERAALNLAQDRGIDVKTLAELRRELRGIVDAPALAGRIEALPRRQRGGFAAKTWRMLKTGGDFVHWAFLNSLLSDPTSHFANVIGTASIQAYHIPERFLAEWVNLAIRTGPEGVQRGETMAELTATRAGLITGWRWFAKAVKTGGQPLGKSQKIEAHFDLNARQFGLDPLTPLGKLAEVGGMVTPTRWMMSEDAFFKGYAHTTEMSALALRQALAEMPAGAPADWLTNRIKMLEAVPTTQMQRQAKDAANLRTLNAPLGPVGQYLLRARGAAGPPGWYLFPFVQTPINSYKWFHQRAPVLSLLSVQNWSDIFAGGAARDMAVSRMLLGSAMAGAVVAMVQAGKITGGMTAGSNKNLKRDLRELGPQSYSWRVGDEYIYYKRTDPMGQYIGAIATAMEIHSQLAADDPDNFDWTDFMVAATLAGSRVSLDTPWLQTFSRMIDALEAPDEQGKRLLLGLARPLVPGIARRLTTSGIGPEAIGLPVGTFPNLVEPRQEIRELESFVDVLKSGSFAFADDISPALHPITGDVILRPPGWGPDVISSLYVTQRRDDPVLMEVVTHRMNFRPPSKMMTGQGDPDRPNLDPTIHQDAVKLSKHQYFRLMVIATREMRDVRGRSMWEAMRDEVAGPGYQRASPGPDGGKELRLKTIYQHFYARASKRLRDDDPVLRDRFNQQRRNRLERQRPQSSIDPATNMADALQAIAKTLGS